MLSNQIPTLLEFSTDDLLMRYFKWSLFAACLRTHDPFEIFCPLTVEENNRRDQLFDFGVKNDFDPRHTFLELVPKVLISVSPEKLQYFTEERTMLFARYEEHLKKTALLEYNQHSSENEEDFAENMMFFQKMLEI